MENRKRFACFVICLCLLLSGIIPETAVAAERWLQTAEGWMYLKGTVVATGWQQIDNTWYWFDDSGIMAVGWKEIDGAWYYFDNGAMVTGTQTIDGTEYTFNDSGVLQEQQQETAPAGWQQAGTDWYYFLDNGTAATGWQQINGTWYYFSNEGVMQTGWVQLDDKWYWFADNGAMATGTVEIDGTQYVFGDDGAWQEEDDVGFTLFGAPWCATFEEVKAMMPEGIELNDPSTAWEMWWKIEDFLYTGNISYWDPLGFDSYCYPDNSDAEPFLYCSFPVKSVHYFFLFTTDETGKPVHDTDYSSLICAELTFENAEDMLQLRNSLLQELTALYGAPDDHREKSGFTGSTSYQDHWAGKNGTHMSLYSSYFGDLYLRFTFDRMDEMLEAASAAEYAATHTAADGEYHISDGTPLKLDSLTLTPDPGMEYIIVDPGEEDGSFSARFYAAVGICDENGDWTGDQMEIYKGSLFTSVTSIHTTLKATIEGAGYTLLPNESYFPTSYSDYAFASKSCWLYDDSLSVFTIPGQEGKYAFFYRIIQNYQESYFIVIWSLDYSSLDDLEKTFGKIITWD